MSTATMRLIVIITSVLGILCTPLSGECQEDYVAGLFEEANRSYEKGVELEGEARAKELRHAAATYEKIIRQGKIENGYLYYNLGNTYYHLGELGMAIADYRRAERFLPNSADLRENLRTALSRRKDRIEKSQIESIWRTLFFWHYLVSFRAKVTAFSVCFILIWGFLFTRLFWRNPAMKWAAVISALLALSLGISFGFERYERNRDRHGVIIAEETEAKKGPHSNAEPEFTAPLHEGTEFRLLEERGGWYRVRLDNGTATWLPAESCQMI